jgi:hypothetical protein
MIAYTHHQPFSEIDKLTTKDFKFFVEESLEILKHQNT